MQKKVLVVHLNFNLSLFRITSDLDDVICKRMLFSRDKSEVLHVKWNNPLPE